MPVRPNKAKAAKPAKQTGLHPRNPHQGRYDLDQLCQHCDELKPFVIVNQYGNQSIDFHDPQAVKVLNRALLMQYYGLQVWDIPDGYLCPPIPGRADYIHHLADLLASEQNGTVPKGKKITGLDIGTGANCIYPILGNRSYGWRFVASDIDQRVVATAQLIVDANPVLKGQISCRQQSVPEQTFRGIIKNGEQYDFTLCNPPFHRSAEDAAAGTRRKLTNLGKKGDNTLNFGGQSNELWCTGGELAFVKRMIHESRDFASQVYLFTSLISKQDNLAPLKRELKKVGAKWVREIKMAQGQKVSRFIAWSFLDEDARKIWRKARW